MRSGMRSGVIWTIVALSVVVYTAAAWVAGVSLVAVTIVGGVVVLAVMRRPFLGVVLVLLSMLLSPEIDASDIKLRLEDLLLPLLAVAMAVRMSLPHARRKLHLGKLGIPIFAIVGANAVASIHGVLCGYVQPLESFLWNLKSWEFFGFYILALNAVDESSDAAEYTKIIIWVFFGIAVYACFQIPETEIYTVNRLTAPFEGAPEPTTLGGYMTIILGVVVASALQAQDRRSRFALWGLSIFCMVPIIFTLSRTTYVSCGLMLFLVAILSRNASMFFSLLLLLLLAPIVLPGQAIERVRMTFQGTGAFGLDSSTLERVEVWRKAWDALDIHPLVGFGLPQQILDSQFVRVIVETGVLGLAAWVLFFAAAVRIGLRVLRKETATPFDRALAVGYVAGTVALLVHALGATTFWITRIMEPYMFLSGLVAAIDLHLLREGQVVSPGGARLPADRLPAVDPIKDQLPDTVPAEAWTLSRSLDPGRAPAVVDLKTFRKSRNSEAAK